MRFVRVRATGDYLKTGSPPYTQGKYESGDLILDMFLKENDEWARNCETLGFEIVAHANADEAYEALQLYPTGEIKIYSTWENCLHENFVHVDEPIKTGNYILYATDDDYWYQIIEVKELVGKGPNS